MNYLTVEAFQDMLKSFDKNNMTDLRDLAIILTLYESGARVSELINIKLSDLRLTKPASVVLYGKGRKVRIIPLDYSVTEILKKYITVYKTKDSEYLFFNSKGEKLTREGVNYILQKHFIKAKEQNITIYPNTISPHCLRHSKAMHLLE
ncbi:tyrosine-type recombinase/integrase, partial [Catenibacterium mitsuokai]